MKTERPLALVLAVFVFAAGFVNIAVASHTWGGYHWARSAHPISIALGDNLSSDWDPYLQTASADWTISSVLDTTVVTGMAKGNCKGTEGRVEVCNSAYGFNGWLGIAQISVSGDHITQGVVKLNDSYFALPQYNSPAWKQLVMCQEVGHTFGLDHQDEDFSNTPLGTCMDYSNDPLPNQHPNAHDYEQLEELYAHLDLMPPVPTTPGKKGNGKPFADVEDQAQWGQEIRHVAEHEGRGATSLFERDLGLGTRVYTFVTWAE